MSRPMARPVLRFSCWLLPALCIAAPLFAQATAPITPAEAVAMAGYRDPALPVQAGWSDDGKRLLILEQGPAHAPGDLVALDPANGRREVLLSVASVAKALSGESSEKGSPPRLRGFTALPSGQLLLRATGGQFLYEPSTGMFLKALGDAEEAENAAFSEDGRAVAYTRGGSLFVKPMPAGPERILARGESPDKLCGEPDWLYGEELDLSTAFWWSPDSRRIAYLVFGEQEVPSYPMADATEIHPEPALQKYPLPGDPNPAVYLVVVDVATGVATAVPGAASRGGYLPWACWSPDGSLLFSLLNRAQDRLDVYSWKAPQEKPQRLLTETAPAWVNVLGPPQFLPDGRFLWLSERDGFAHLYLHAPSGAVIRQLTSGPWVVEELLWHDANSAVISGNRDNSLGSQAYRVPLAGGAVERVTPAGGWHTCEVSAGGRWLYDRHSAGGDPGGAAVRDLRGKLPERLLFRVTRGELDRRDYSGFEFVTVKAADGTPLSGQLYKPKDFDPAKKYPVLVEVYGGPSAQVVQDRWGGRWEPIYQMFLQHGFLLFSLDNRGSARRGRDFESTLLRRSGKVELEDQLAGLAWLKSQPFVDGGRVGIWGWSYGGYMTLYALANAPSGSFSAGVAVAPVSDWMNYDTCYTERYLKLPADNPDGYRDSSPAHQAERFTAPVLLLHGLSDDNVHFGNSVQMADALLKAGQPFESQFYPRMDHSIHERPARADLFSRMLAFFERQLKE